MKSVEKQLKLWRIISIILFFVLVVFGFHCLIKSGCIRINSTPIDGNKALTLWGNSSGAKDKLINYVKIVTDDNKQAEKLILKEFPEIKIELKNKEIHILSQLEKIAKINTLLVQNKISVSEISNSEGSFEEYFIERLGK